MQRTLENADLILASSTIKTISFIDDLTIIWVDNNLDEKLKNLLSDVEQNILYCNETRQLIEILNAFDADTDRAILILSGILSNEILPLVHYKDVVDSIYVFCMNLNNYQALKNEYPKIISMHNEYIKLFNELQKQLHTLKERHSTIHLFDRQQYSIQELRKKSTDYLWFKLLRNTLVQMTDSSADESKQEMIEYCRLFCRSRPKQLKEIDDFENNYRSSDDAIRWYSKNSFLFRLLNHTCRAEDINGLIKLRYFITDLSTKLTQLYKESSSEARNFTVYRGTRLANDDIDKLKQNVGKLIATNGFLSTTSLYQVASAFAANVIFEINIDTNEDQTVFANITSCSHFADEQEVLFDIGSIFEVTNVEYCDELNVWFVSLNGATSKDDDRLKNEYITIVEHEMQKDSNVTRGYMLAKHLIEMDRESEAIQYLKSLLRHATIHECINKKVAIYYYLGLAYSSFKFFPFEGGLENAQLCYDLAEEISNKYWLRLSLKLLGKLYVSNEQYSYALNCFDQSFDIAQETADYDCIVGIYHNKASMYFKLKDYQNALKCCKEVMTICETRYPMMHSITAKHYNLLASIFKNQNKLTEAFECYKKSLLMILENIYPTGHLDITTAYAEVISLCYVTKKYEDVFEYINKNADHWKIFPRTSISIFPSDLLKFYKASGDVEKYNTYLAKFCRQTDYKSLQLLADLYTSLNKDDLALKYNMDAAEQIFSRIQENVADQKATKKLLTEGKSIINRIEIQGNILYTETTQYELALRHFNESLNFQIKYFPTHYEEHAALLKNIAMCYVKMNMIDTALSFLYHAVETLKAETLSSDKYGILLLELYEYIGYCYEIKHNDHFSTYYYKKSFEIYEKLSVEQLLYKNVENQSLELGLTNLSLDYYQHKLKILEDCLSNTDDQSTLDDDDIILCIIAAKYRISTLYEEKAEFYIAFDHLKQALERQVEHFPGNECFIGDIYNAMAWNLCLSDEQLDLAMDYCAIAFSIYEHELQMYNFDFAYILHTLSYLHYKHRHYSNAISYCIQALALAKREKRQKNESLLVLAMCYELLGNIERNKGYLPKAFKYYLRSLNTMKTLKSNHIKHIERIAKKINSLNETNTISRG